MQSSFLSCLFFFSILFCFLSGEVIFGQGAEIVQIKAEGSSSNANKALARAESLKAAIENGSLQVIASIIGETSLTKKADLLRKKILPLSSRYVAFYKASEPVRKGSVTITSLSLKISLTSLKDLLTRTGLLFQTEGLATVLPLFRIYEKKPGGATYSWWREDAGTPNSYLRGECVQIIRQLESVFRPKNFFIIDPVTNHYTQWLPEIFRSEILTTDDLTFYSRFFSAQMILVGEIYFEAGEAPGGGIRSQIKFTTINASNGKVVGEVTRTFSSSSSDWIYGEGQIIKEAFSEVSRDLASQVGEEWTKGTFGASLVKVSLRGSMNYQDLESFKKQIMTKISNLKSVRERRLEKGNAVFEFETPDGPGKIAKKIESASFEGFRTTLDSVLPDKVELHWSKVAKR